MPRGDTDVDFVRLVQDGEVPPDEAANASDFDAVEPLPGDEPYDTVSLDFVALYVENFNHFVRLAAILDPDEPDELIDKAFLEVARQPDPPTTRGEALLEVRDALVRQHRNRFLRPRRALITLPEFNDTVIDRLEDLPVFQRDSLVLHHYAAMTPAEIADVWRTSEESVDDHLDFAEAAFDATEVVGAGDIGDRIRRSINAALVDFEGEPDVEGFEKKLGRRSRKPALIALGGVAAAAVLIIAIAMWRASPAGEPFVGPSRADREVAGSSTTKAPTTTTVPSIITLPPNNRTTSTTPGTTRRPTATTRRGQSGGGGGGGAAPGTDPTNPPGTDPTTPGTDPTTPGTDPTTPTTQSPPLPEFTASKLGCVAGGGQAFIVFAGKSAPGADITVSSNHGGGGATADGDGNWRAEVTFGGIDPIYDNISGSISSSAGGSQGFGQEITLGFLCT